MNKEKDFIIELESVIQLLIMLQQFSIDDKALDSIDLSALLNLPIGIIIKVSEYLKEKVEQV